MKELRVIIYILAIEIPLRGHLPALPRSFGSNTPPLFRTHSLNAILSVLSAVHSSPMPPVLQNYTGLHISNATSSCIASLINIVTLSLKSAKAFSVIMAS